MQAVIERSTVLHSGSAYLGDLAATWPRAAPRSASSNLPVGALKLLDQHRLVHESVVFQHAMWLAGRRATGPPPEEGEAVRQARKAPVEQFLEKGLAGGVPDATRDVLSGHALRAKVRVRLRRATRSPVRMVHESHARRLELADQLRQVRVED